MKDKEKKLIEEFRAKYEPELAIVFNEIKNISPMTDVVLKSHLLIEDLLNKILKKQLVTSKYFDELKLGFYQKVYLCRSLGNMSEDKEWNLIILLNNYRNVVAHNLNSADRKKRLEAIKTVIWEFAQHNSFSCKGFDDIAFVEAAFLLSHQFLFHRLLSLCEKNPLTQAEAASNIH